MNKPAIIKHRVNTLEQLETHEAHWGAEIDLRTDLNHPQKLHLSHDPWVRGIDFEKWLDKFVEKKISGILILNTKEDGLEAQCTKLLQQKKVSNYFFLDTTIPTLAKLGQASPTFFSVRYSKFENLEFALGFKNYAKWVWVDCFDKQPVAADALLKLKQAGFKLCLVAPELQGGQLEDPKAFQEIFKMADAICTKFEKLLP